MEQAEVMTRFKEIGIQIRAQRERYRATSTLYKLREAWRTRKTKRAREHAKEKFFQALRVRFPEGSLVDLAGLNFDAFSGGSFATYKGHAKVRYVTPSSILFDVDGFDRVELFYDPCGHDNLQALEESNKWKHHDY